LAFVEGALAAMEPDDRAALVLFGADALVERPMMGGWELGEIASIPRTHQTDLESAIRLGTALFPAGFARRMVILSDGRPTLGQAEQATRLARAQGVQVDVAPLLPPLAGEGQGEVEAWLSELAAPDWMHQGEEFTLSITARATSDVEAMLTILVGDRVVTQEQVRLNPGANTFAVPLTATEPGFTSLRAYLTPLADIYPQNNALSAFTMVEGPPRVLVVHRDAATAPTAPLRAAGLVVEESTPGALPSDPASLAGYGAVVLVDTPAQSLSPRAMNALQSYVRDLGGGLVAVGGPHSYGVGGWYDTPLEETLPVEMTIHDPERFPPMSIVVVIDKSGSMSAQEDGVQKIRLAGEAAARVAELINDLDEITVIAFDDRPADVIGPLPGSRRDEVIDRTTRLQAGGGGIYVRESLQEALRYLADSDRTVRHIILLSDGADSEHQEGVRELIEREMAAPENNITLSTVAIGAGQDLGFLEDIAELGGGRYHFTNQAANLPVIFAQETQLAMRSYIVEEPFYPQQTSRSPILTGIESTPQLAGYVATTPKPAGRVILSTHQDDPLLASWQYGLGRAVAWTSDATGRWAQQWVTWDGFSRFWAQAIRWTIVERADAPVEMAVTLEGEQAHIVVDAVGDDGAFVDGLNASVSLVGPEGEPLLVELLQTAPGRYEGAFIPQAEGAYLMRLMGQTFESAESAEPAIALTTGWVMSYSPEYAALEGDPAYLEHLAELGGGNLLEDPAGAFAHTLRGEGAARDLWPYLLGLATLLLPFDVGVRRLALGRRDLEKAWAWVMERFQRALSPARGGERGEEVPSPVGRLFEAKSRAGERKPAGGVTPEAAPLAERPPAPTPPSRPAPPPAPPVTERETLAERLLRQKRGRDEKK
ncbi:MAG: VWA domain-containing protein, partial [Chloroflexota bacterium]|nr:VWA domain-containing protein [Chloroflexota bacterium]